MLKDIQKRLPFIGKPFFVNALFSRRIGIGLLSSGAAFRKRSLLTDNRNRLPFIGRRFSVNASCSQIFKSGFLSRKNVLNQALIANLVRFGIPSSTIRFSCICPCNWQEHRPYIVSKVFIQLQGPIGCPAFARYQDLQVVAASLAAQCKAKRLKPLS